MNEEMYFAKLFLPLEMIFGGINSSISMQIAARYNNMLPLECGCDRESNVQREEHRKASDTTCIRYAIIQMI